MRKTFPASGQARDEVLNQLRSFKQDDADWSGGRVPLFVFKGSGAAAEISQDAYNIFFTENALGRTRAFPSIQRMEQDIVEMALDLFQAPDEASGFITTGGTESIIQAVQTCRDYERAKRDDPTHRGNIVMAYSGHPAFDKAAGLMDLEVRRVPCGLDYRADVSALECAIDANTIMLVGSAPCFPYGVFDPIEDLSAVAERHNIWLHVDACVGGYLAPFVRQSGRPIPAFDFSVPGVSSMSADLHKFGFAPKPISTVFYRNPDKAAHHGFEFHDWPNGRFATTTIVGTRAGGAIAGAWALFQHLGRDGYTVIASELMTGIEAYRAEIEGIENLHVLGAPELSIVAVGSNKLDIFRIAEIMQGQGWVPGLLQSPKALHRMMSMLHVPAMPQYLADLKEATATVDAESGKGAIISAEY